jgi:hypothetical protein
VQVCSILYIFLLGSVSGEEGQDKKKWQAPKKRKEERNDF